MDFSFLSLKQEGWIPVIFKLFPIGRALSNEILYGSSTYRADISVAAQDETWWGSRCVLGCSLILCGGPGGASMDITGLYGACPNEV